MDLCLQVAGDGDVRPMLAIYAPYVRDTAITFEYEVPTAEEFGARLHQVLPSYPWLVCRAPGQVLGYAYAHRHMERAAYGWNVECSVYVLGSARGHGVGRALYGALLELLRLQGVVNAYGCIAVPNEASEALHRAAGFSLLGRFPASGWKQGRWHDIVWDDAWAAGNHVERAGLERIFREADFISLHTSLDDSTRHLVDAPRLALMKPTAILINTARGELVDGPALLEALEQKRIYGAGLDVFEQEPPQDARWYALDNLVMGSHCSSSTSGAVATMGHMAVSNLLRDLGLGGSGGC